MERLVFTAAILVLLCYGLHDVGSAPAKGELRRTKRNLGSTSVNSLLQHFIGRMTTVEKLIREQEKTMRSHMNEIRILRWLLRQKGSVERMREAKSDVEHQSVLLEHAVHMYPFLKYKERFDLMDRKLKRISKAIKRDYTSMHEIYRRVMIHKKLTCRPAATAWSKKAGDMIGSLAKHDVACDKGELLQMVLFHRKDGSFDGKVRYDYKCCKINIKDKWSLLPKVDY